MLSHTQQLALPPTRQDGFAVTVDQAPGEVIEVSIWVVMQSEREWVRTATLKIDPLQLVPWSPDTVRSAVVRCLRTPVESVVDSAVPPF